MNYEALKTYGKEVDEEVTRNILPFWINHAIDKENNGFYNSITNDLKINKTADKGSILQTRILWTFSKGYGIYKNPEYLKIAKRAYDYLLEYFIDHEYNGVYWLLNYKGEPVINKKQIYAQAFAVYGLSEYYSITHDIKALNIAKNIYQCIEKYAYDEKHKGYFDACDRKWALEEDMRLSEKDLNARKSMNTILHIFEAYANLYKVSPDKTLKNKLIELLNITMDHIIDQKNHHFKLYFDDEWNSLGNHKSFGHDIEGSWLLFEAAEIICDEKLMERVKGYSIKMAKTILLEGLEKNGFIAGEKDDEGIINENKEWWTQAEAMVGFLNAYQITRDEVYLEHSIKIWDLVKKYYIDKKYGEWFSSINNEMKADPGQEKVGIWKCPYHNSRACFEVKNRIDDILEQI